MTFISQLDDGLVRLIAEDRAAGLERLTKMAEAGDPSAIVELGLYLSEEQRTTEAEVKWLLLGNELGSAEAAWNLAMIARERGKSNEMRQWIDRAADLGEEDAKEVQLNGYDVESVLAKYRG